LEKKSLLCKTKGVRKKKIVEQQDCEKTKRREWIKAKGKNQG